MTSDITGITPLGLNLGGAFGDYSSYLPSSMGMGMGMGAMNGMGYAGGMTGMNGMNGMAGMGGMMGMMGPMMEYQQYMTKLQRQLDMENLDHMNAMHRGMVDNEARAYEDTLSAMARQLLADSAVQSGVMNLHDKIVQGDQNGIVQEYEKLERVILSKYEDQLDKYGSKVDRASDVRSLIEQAYGNLVSANSTDGHHDLRADIEKYCDSAFKEGIVSGFRGEKNQRYKEKTINHIYGQRIEHYNSKQREEKIGKGVGIVGSAFKDVIEGFGLGAGACGVVLTTSNLLSKIFQGKNGSWWFFKGLFDKSAKGAPFVRGALRWAGIAGIALVGASDIIKRINNKNN